MLFRSFIVVGAMALLSACVSLPPAHDYSAFKAANPASVII